VYYLRSHAALKLRFNMQFFRNQRHTTLLISPAKAVCKNAILTVCFAGVQYKFTVAVGQAPRGD
jgi:hypothetical protein